MEKQKVIAIGLGGITRLGLVATLLVLFYTMRACTYKKGVSRVPKCGFGIPWPGTSVWMVASYSKAGPSVLQKHARGLGISCLTASL
jgi:hypothetical protein